LLLLFELESITFYLYPYIKITCLYCIVRKLQGDKIIRPIFSRNYLKKYFVFQIIYKNVFCILFPAAKLIEKSTWNTILKSNLYFVIEIHLKSNWSNSAATPSSLVVHWIPEWLVYVFGADLLILTWKRGHYKCVLMLKNFFQLLTNLQHWPRAAVYCVFSSLQNLSTTSRFAWKPISTLSILYRSLDSRVDHVTSSWNLTMWEGREKQCLICQSGLARLTPPHWMRTTFPSGHDHHFSLQYCLCWSVMLSNVMLYSSFISPY